MSVELRYLAILKAHIASRNPTLEDQALARIYRMGQTQEVTTIRLSVQNSFEEVSTMLKVQ